MAELLITQAVTQAEEAIETGNYGGAIETCQRILGEFPEFARAHRIMAEAYAEQGDADAAKQAYQRTLERDPQSIAAHLGLGMIAEDAGEMEAALAHFQVSWEIDPRRRDLREHVSRVSQEVYGNDGRLYLTRAALASLHFHAGRWDRAITEAAQVLQELNQRVDVQVRMAEALWRRGDDAQAKQVCTSILRTLPAAVVPLLILADIHRREGNQSDASDLRTQARAIDPDGVRAADLIMVGLDEQADFLSVDDIPTIEERILTEEPTARYVPAPDFSAEEVDSSDTAAEAPVSETPTEQALDSTPGEGMQPFRWEDVGDEDLEVSDLESTDEQLDEDLSSLMQEETHQQAEKADSSDEETVSFDLFTDEEIEQARPGDERPAGFTGMLKSLDSEGVEPFDPMNNGSHGDTLIPEQESVVTGESTSDEPSPAETSTDDTPDVASEDVSATPESAEELAASDNADDDVFDLDWSQVDEEIQDAIPGETPRGYTDELRDLDSSGVEPFAFDQESREDVLDEDVGESSVADNLEEDLLSEGDSEQVEDAREESSQDLDLDELTRDWESSETPETGHVIEMGPPAEEPVDLESIDDLFGEFVTTPFEEVEETPSEEFAEPDAEQPDEIEVDPVIAFDFDEPEDVADETRDLATGAVEEDTGDLASVFDESWTEPEGSDEAEASVFETVFDDSVFEVDSVGAETDQVDDLESARQAVAGLGLTDDLFERARAVKAQLVEEGRLESGRKLPGFGGVTIDDLRSAVESDPLNADHRISLAAALIDISPDEALDQYRWIYRNASDRGPEIVEDLARLIETTREREVGALRLLGAVYRRHGDWLAAASHYEESLIVALRNLR